MSQEKLIVQVDFRLNGTVQAGLIRINSLIALIFNITFDLNCEIVPSCFPLRTVAFRGHGDPLL